MRPSVIALGFILCIFIGTCIGTGIGLLAADRFQLTARGVQYRPVQTFADGSVYAGPLNEEGLAEGRGTMDWSNGDHYEGEFKQGMMHGRGLFTSTNGYRYEGQFHNGLSEGRGEIHYTDGLVYVGDVDQGYWDGKGTLTYPDGRRYEGDFKLNQFEGSGRWYEQDQLSYVGEFKSGQYHGRGVAYYQDGSRYTGQFIKGQYHGTGSYETAAGDLYDGEFVNNTFTGKGVIAFADGRRQVGEFENWTAHGDGVETDADGNQYIGRFDDGMLNAEGEYIGADGERYKGGFSYNRFNGEGEHWSPEGDYYKGQFRYGSKHGKGRWVAADGEEYTGTWRQGKLVSAAGSISVHSPEEIAEHALYQQLPLLEQTLAKVKPGNENQVELFTLALGSYGSEEVFNREINYIQQDFQQRFGNQDHSIFLSNSRRALEQRPLATLTSLKKSLATLAEKMNPDEDILFLYITSHGSADQTISIEHPGLSLSDLKATQLRTMLDEAHIKWRVIVLSACYSGGFIDSLKNDNTLIITAASADRTSFGCADNRDFTYFGQAYFKEALPKADSFMSAFNQADALIRKWEAEEDKQHSNPQMVHGDAIVEQLKKWRTQTNPAH
ncbi:MAG: peptidase C13 [Pseudomonadales bacterium]|nr:peptidase C13 [Pseudomonadales bacterium]